jgi:hypothetical protein
VIDGRKELHIAGKAKYGGDLMMVGFDEPQVMGLQRSMVVNYIGSRTSSRFKPSMATDQNTMVSRRSYVALLDGYRGKSG